MRLSHTWPSLPPSLPPHLHFTWHSALHLDIALTQQAEVEELKDRVVAQQVFLETQQEEIAAHKAAHEQQEQEREVCASPIGITALHALRTILTLGTALHLDHALSPAGAGGGASGYFPASAPGMGEPDGVRLPMTISVSHSRLTLITRATTNPTLP